MKRRAFLENLLKKAGFTGDQIKDFIEKLEDEYSDDEAVKALAALMTADEAKGNDEIFKDVKRRTKAEALDPIDNLLKTYEPKLTAEQKAEYSKLGADSFKKYQFVLKSFAEVDTKTGDKNYDDLKADYEALKTSLTTDYVPKTEHETVTGKLTAREQEIQNVRILNAAIRSGKLKDVSGDRHFDRNFIADAHELLATGIGEKKIKGVIDHATGKIMRADSPEQPLLIDNKALDINGLAELTISAFDYAKKSDATPTNTVQVPTGGSQSSKSLTPAQKAMIEEELANK